jgi:hypothetical protein
MSALIHGRIFPIKGAINKNPDGIPGYTFVMTAFFPLVGKSAEIMRLPGVFLGD